MKPIRRLLYVVVFIIGAIIMAFSIVLSVFQWLFSGRVTLVDHLVDFLDKIANDVNPD